MTSTSVINGKERSKNASPNAKQVILCTVYRPGGRAVAFGIAGDPSDMSPTLFFYPGGGNRRMLQTLHVPAKASKLKLICVNRPGMGGTSKAETQGAAGHVATACDDAAFVLDSLGFDRASLLFMCAGTPFALAFATQKPERTTGKLMGISSWVLPADCGSCNTKFGYRIGTWSPSLVAPLVGNTVRSMCSSVSSLPHSWVVHGLRRKLSHQERNVFDASFTDTEFFEIMVWMGQEKGGTSDDVSVLLSTCKDVGIDYGKITGDYMVFWHGEKDTMVPIAGVKWLSEQIPSSVLRPLPGGTHEGAGFLLYASIVDSLIFLGA